MGIGGLKFGSVVTRFPGLIFTYSAKSTLQTYYLPISQLCPATYLSLPSLRKARRIFYLNHHQPRIFDMSLSLCIAFSSKFVCLFTCFFLHIFVCLFDCFFPHPEQAKSGEYDMLSIHTIVRKYLIQIYKYLYQLFFF